MTLSLPVGFYTLAAATALLQRSSRGWRLAAIGAVAYGLGVAAVVPELPIAEQVSGSFGAVNAGLLLLGAVAVLLGALLAGSETKTPIGRSLAILAGGAALAALVPILPLIILNGLPLTLGLALLLALGIAALLWLLQVTRLGQGFRWLDARFLVPPPHPRAEADRRATRWWLGLIVVSTLAIFVAPLTLVILAWPVLVLLALHQLRRDRGIGSRWPVAAIGVGLLLAWTLRWLIPIAGEGIGVSWAAMLDAPVSSAAAVMLIPLVLLAGWLVLGLWPFVGLGGGPIAALTAMPILAGLGRAVLADGMVHVAPLLGIAVVLVAAHAAATADPARLLGAFAMLALLGGTHAGDVASQLLLGAAFIGALWSWELHLERWRSLAWTVVGLLAAVGGLWAVADALRMEVVSTVCVLLAA
ncbi:MAG: hypothetical protein ACHQXA_10070, partial [Gemmatimonadales bacterium]